MTPANDRCADLSRRSALLRAESARLVIDSKAERAMAREVLARVKAQYAEWLGALEGAKP